MRRQLGIDVAEIIGRAMADHGWHATPQDYAAEVTRLVDGYVRQLEAELDSATRLNARWQMRHDEALAVVAEVGA